MLLALFFVSSASAQKAKWLKQRPISNKEYIGIGSASLDDDNYMEVAKQNAFSDIASQIATKVDASAFMETVDLDGKSKQLFKEKITNTMSAWVEGIEIADTYKDKNRYYVYCTLNKETYRKNAEARRDEAISKGKDYLLKGREAQNSMKLNQAVLLYGKGLEAVEPWLFMNLSTMVDGRKIDVAAELYNAYISVFSGMIITTNVVNIETEAFKAVETPIAACLSKDGEVVPNVKLAARFISGEGVLTAPIETDYNGTSEFYIKNITSSNKLQEIEIAIDKSFVESLPESYRKLIGEQNLPIAKVTVALAKGTTSAYLYVSNKNDIKGVENEVRKVISPDYFTMTEDINGAAFFVELTSSMEAGGVVSGGVGNLNSNYCSLTLKIYDNSTQDVVLEYSIDNVKVLVPSNKNKASALQMCLKEIAKRIRRDLPKQLKNINL